MASRRSVLGALVLSACTTGVWSFQSVPSGLQLSRVRRGALSATNGVLEPGAICSSRRSVASRLSMQAEANDEPAWPSDSSGSVAFAEPSAEGALYQCPQCKSAISLDDTSCGSCAAPIQRKSAFVDLTPESTAKKSNDADLVGQATNNPFLSVALSQIGAQLTGQV